MKSLVVVFLATVFSLLAHAQNNISVRLNPDSIRIGEQVTLEWEMDVPVKANVFSMPSIPDSLASGIEVLSRSDVKSKESSGRKYFSQQLQISVYDSGRFVFPALTAGYVLQNDSTFLQSDSLWLYATTVAVDTTSAAKDVKDIYNVEPEPDYTWMWYVGGGVLLAILAFVLFYFLRKKKKMQPEVVEEFKLNPADEAIRLLRQMQNDRSWMRHTPKDFYTEVTDVLRKYLEYAFQIQAAEMVSSEITDAVQQIGMAYSPVQRLKTLLMVADMAKFARFKPEPGQFEHSLADAIAFVVETRPAVIESDDKTPAP